MRLAFLGTPAFAAASLAELVAAGHEIAAAYTQPPKPSGRGRKLTPSPVQAIAEAHGIEVRTPNGFRRPEVREAFAALDVEAAIVVAYGFILPREILEAPRLGCFNLHASLLPRWRGAAPIHRAIMAGDQVTGVQVMRMEEGLDTGPVLLSETVAIRDDDTAASLTDRLAQIGAQLLPRFLSALERGGLSETRQTEEGATYAGKISPLEAKIEWERPAREVDCRIRGLSPYPGAWFDARSERVKVLMSRVAAGSGAPGDIIDGDGRLVVACGEGAVELTRLQRAGKAAQDAAAFLRGFPFRRGDRL